MSKRLTKALLRLCELEKKALETEVDFWKQEVKLNTQAFKEIVETNHELHRGLGEAQVKLKALAEENERLRKNAGWIHIGDWFSRGRGRIVGQFLDGSLSLMELRGSQWYLQGTGLEMKTGGPPVYLYELPEPPIQTQVEETDAKSEHPDAEIKLALESA